MKRKRKKIKKQLWFFLIFFVFLLLGNFCLTRKKTLEKEVLNIICPKELTTELGKAIDLIKNIEYDKNTKIDIHVEGDYDFNRVGEYSLYYVIKDENGNEKKEPFLLKVISYNDADITIGEKPYKTSKGFKIEEIDGVTYIDGTLIVNKTYSLPSTYGNGLTEETKTAFQKLRAAALLDGFDIYIASGFRSYDRQVTLYNNYVQRDGIEGADTYSARPGHSEHQSGLTFDVNEVSDKFHNTPEANWLENNCYKYGFILRFPNGKEKVTGFKYESWHFRYVGEELAKKLFNNGDWITLEEYFGISSVYQN